MVGDNLVRTLFNIPRVLEILLDMCVMWDFQSIFSSTKIPKNFATVTLAIGTPLILIELIGETSSLRPLPKSIKFDFLRLRNNLLERNQVASFASSAFAVVNRSGKFLSVRHKFVSSAKRMKWNSLEHSDISFIYSRKSRGPNIEPWGTPQVIGNGGEE